MDALKCLKTRRSVREYEDTTIENSVLIDIVDCGRLAASGINIQPATFVVVTNKQTLGKLADAADHGKFIRDAGACIVVVCDKTKYYIEDGAAATQNILLAAKAHGLGSCWIAGDKKDYCQDILKIINAPEDKALFSLISLGIAKNIPTPPKKSINEVLIWEKY